MTMEEFLRDRVIRPVYGAAPAELVAQHKGQLQKLAEMHRDGLPLTCDALRCEIEVADALALQIMKHQAGGATA